MKAIAELVHEVTGAKMYTFFSDRPKPRGFGRIPRALTAWQLAGKPGHMFRRLYVRYPSEKVPHHAAAALCCIVNQ